MCYDSVILSAYSDGEVSADLAQEVSEHLQECSRCRQIAAKHNAVNFFLNKTFHIEQAELTERQGQLQNRLRLQLRKESRRRYWGSFWRQRVAVPVPLLAMGILVLLLVGFLWFESFPPGSSLDGAPQLITQQTGSSTGEYGDIENLIQFLSSQGAAVEVRIELPSSSRFEVLGEPQLLKAADVRRDLPQ